MIGKVQIRPFQSSDQAGVEWLYSRTPPWGRTYPRPQPIPESLTRINDSHQLALVAVEQDRAGEAVVGLTTIIDAGPGNDVPVPDFINLERRVARLHRVLVAPERWRHGIGTRMVDEAVAWSREHGYEAVILDTTSDQEGAVEFYRALDFSESGRTTFRDWEIVWFELHL
jgi:GNAT superfamily N-acetyltransferase